MSKSRLAFLLIAALSIACYAKERPIDTAHSKITINVGKSGIFSAAGHDHKVNAPISEGAIDDEAGRVWFRVESARITVLPEKDQAAVQNTMQRDVLESGRFPQIRFESTSAKKVNANTWAVTGNLTLHGHTNPESADVHFGNRTYIGQLKLRQTQYGIQPVKVAGGTVKVKDELTIEFVITAVEFSQESRSPAPERR